MFVLFIFNFSAKVKYIKIYLYKYVQGYDIYVQGLHIFLKYILG